MKKTLLFAIMAAVLGFTACSKEEPSQTETPQKGMILHATVAQPEYSKATFTDNEGVWHFDFSVDDQITVTNNKISTDYTFTYNGTDFISSDAEPTSEAARWYAYYPSREVSLVGQTGKWEDLANVYAMAGSTPYFGGDVTGEDGLDITMDPANIAFLKIVNEKGSVDINVKDRADSWVKGLTVSGSSFIPVSLLTKQTLLSTTEKGTYYIAVPAGRQLVIKDGDEVLKSTGTSGLQGGKYYDLTIAAIPTFTVTFDMNGKSGTAPKSLKEVPYGSTITKPSDPTGAIFEFTGWYKDKACTGVWNFNSDIVTENITLYAGWGEWPIGALRGVFTVNAEGKKVYFSWGNLWRDNDGLFHFEESQYDFNDGEYNESHISHFMWSKDVDVACALRYYDPTASDTDVLFTNADQITSNSNFTVNGQKGVWRTLSVDEWTYLVDHNGSLWTTIDGINGRIIFCDGYSGSRTGLSEIPNGCLFLPAAGCRLGRDGDTDVNHAGSAGYYWSASPFYDYYAHDLSFISSNVNPYHYDNRYQAYAVRLVTESK